jgi:alkylation response protein AidB-like acyl-CoA dehydrogenase
MKPTVTLDADQEEIRGVARGFLRSRYPSERVRELIADEDGFEQSAWEEIAALGWTGIAVPEDRGGAGYTLVERCLLLEEMGRIPLPGPYFSSAVLAADALEAAAGDAGAEVLAAIAAGSTRAALVAGGDLLGGKLVAGAVTAGGRGGEERLNGEGGLTVDGASAELLIVAAALEPGGVGLFAVDPGAAGVTRTPAPTIDETRKVAAVFFADSPGRRLDAGEDTEGALRQGLDRSAVGLAAESVGGARQAIEMTVEYLNDRQQFGGPIGRFQALKHRLAELHVEIDGAREGVYGAAEAMLCADAESAAAAAAAAKSAAADGFARATAEAIQLHGGIGFTEEHDIGLFYKRALVGVEMLGTPLAWRERIAAGLSV